MSEVMTLSESMSESMSESVSEVQKNLVSVSEPTSKIEFFYLSVSESALDMDSGTNSCRVRSSLPGR